MKSRWTVVWILFLSTGAAIDAQSHAFWSFLKQGTVVSRCSDSTPAHKVASAALRRLGGRISQSKDPNDLAGVIEELHTLLKTECFLPAAETERVPQPDTNLSLREWWTAGGGHAWLSSVLDLPEFGVSTNLDPHIVVPADTRSTLNLDDHRDHPLQMLLCASNETSCGTATRGWKLRADAYFEAYHIRDQRNWSDRYGELPASGIPMTSRQCVEYASRADVDLRYQTWRSCLESRRPKRIALPLGEFKAPASGWLIVSGRRGHDDFCETARAYDLASGAAFISDGCPALVLRPGGSVERNATMDLSVNQVRAGIVSTENLREAVWMLLFRGEAEQVQTKAEYYPLPEGLIPQFTVGALHEGTAIGRGGWGHSGQTSLTWRWQPSAGSAFNGEVTWPDSADAAEDHAASLLSIVDAGFAEGCISRRPPELRNTSHSTRRLNQVSAEAIGGLETAYHRASAEWKALTRCRSGRMVR